MSCTCNCTKTSLTNCRLVAIFSCPVTASSFQYNLYYVIGCQGWDESGKTYRQQWNGRGRGKKKCDEKEKKRAQQGFEPVLPHTTSMLSPLETTYACYKYLHFLVLYSSAWSLRSRLTDKLHLYLIRYTNMY